MFDGFFEPKFSRRKPPWGDRASLYSSIHKRTSGGTSAHGQTPLPDAESAHELPGALDGERISQGQVRENEKLAGAVYHALVRALETRDDICYARLYELVEEDRAIEYVDQVLDAILEGRELEPDALQDLALWWAAESPDRGAVKFAVALLGLFDSDECLPLLLTLGRHEEFTLFAAVALSNREGEPGPLLLDLARDVHGWGRIQVVELLCESPGPDVRRWLLTEGFRSELGGPDLAALCARAGRLSRTLAKLRKLGKPRRASSGLGARLLAGAAEIVLTLLDDPTRSYATPNQRFAPSSYKSLGDAVEHLIALLSRGCKLGNLPVVVRVHDVLASTGVLGTLEGVRAQQTLETCRAIMSHPAWQDLIEAQLKSPSKGRRRRARKAAGLLGIQPGDSRSSDTSPPADGE